MNTRFIVPLGISLIVGLGAVAFAQDNPGSVNAGAGDPPAHEDTGLGQDAASRAEKYVDPLGMPVLKPDANVFEQMTDLQRRSAVFEKQIALESLKLKRKEMELQAKELAQKEEDRDFERQQVKLEKEQELKDAKDKKEREDALKQAEEDLRLAEIRAQQETLLRSIEEQAKKDEQKKEEQAKIDKAKAEQDIVLGRDEARRTVRGVKQDQQPLIMSPAQAGQGDSIENQLAALAPLVGTQPGVPAQEPPKAAPVAPPPMPNPVVRSVKGVGGQLVAHIILPEGGVIDASEGDRIPGGWKVVRVDQEGVFVKKAKDKKTTRLSFGTKIDMPVEETAVVEPQPQANGFSIPLASNNFPIPSGMPTNGAVAGGGTPGNQ